MWLVVVGLIGWGLLRPQVAGAGAGAGIFREDSVRTDGVVFTRVRDTTEHRVCYVLSAQGGAWWFQGTATLNTANFQCFPEASAK